MDLAERAARSALEAAGIDPRELDLIVVGTTTPDRIYPATACRLQARLGTRGCPRLRRAGGLHRIHLRSRSRGSIRAYRFRPPRARRGRRYAFPTPRLDGSRDLHSLRRWRRRRRARSRREAGHLLHPLARRRHLRGPPLCGWRGTEGQRRYRGWQRVHQDAWQRGLPKSRFARFNRIVDETLAANNLQKSDIDWLIPHQANIRIIEATARKLGLPMERVVITIDEHGNTSAASVPLALDVAVRDGRIKRGTTCCWKPSAAGSPGARP